MRAKVCPLLFWSLFQYLTISCVDGANIMFFLGMSSYSHRVGVWPLAEKLSERGHSLTFVSPFPNKKPHPKIQDYVPLSLKNWMEAWNETAHFFSLRVSNQLDKDWFSLPDYGISMCEVLMNDPEYVNWLNTSKFDIVFVDALWNECAYGMAYKLKAKIIVISTAAFFPHFPDPFGIPDESSWIPDMVYHYPQDMNIYQRFVTMMVPLYFNYLREMQYFPKLEEITRDKLMVKDMPSFSQIERNVSLVFLNHHYAEDYARPFPPNVIPIAGMHCLEKQEKLPKEMEEFINKGSQGFIYISFGSYAELSIFPKEIQDAFLNTVKKLTNIQFIWKINIDELKWTDLPQNVYAAKWMPQQAILSHPKIQAFITHGGLFGIQEAICNSVPLIAFPIFAEQDYNAVKIESREIGIKLEITTITEPQLEDAINKMLTDQKYRKNMKQVSVAFKDRPAKPVDTAVWWTEFVLRHEGTAFLRPGSVHQSWWKKRQLDIWALIFLTILLLIRIVYGVIKFALSVLFKDGKSNVSKKIKSS